MEAMSPLKVMSRGYSLVYKGKKIIADTKNLKTGDNVDVMLAEGRFSACVTEIESAHE
jgi:exodeoxyribonuclease VII large subunit